MRTWICGPDLWARFNPAPPARKRVLFRFHENAKRRVDVCVPRRGGDKRSFRLTARPQDGPKASRLPSLGREIFSLHLFPPSAIPRPRCECAYTSSKSCRVSHSALRLPPFAPALVLARSRYDTLTLQARVAALRAVEPHLRDRGNHGTTIFDSGDLRVSDTERNKKKKKRRGGSTKLEVDRNFYPREIEYARGLWVCAAGGFTGHRMVFYIPTAFLSFPSPRGPASHASAEPRCRGSAMCAQNLNPLVIKSELYATAHGVLRARTFTLAKK